MFKNRLEDLWKTAASDGAASPVGPGNPRTGAEFEQLMAAWFLERSRSIESELLLDRTRAILARVLAGGVISDNERRQVRVLIRAIDRTGRI